MKEIKIAEEVVVEEIQESTVEQEESDEAVARGSVIQGIELADHFADLEGHKIPYDSIEAYKITRTDGLPLFAGGVLSRIRATLKNEGKLYIEKSLHTGNEDILNFYLGEYENARGRCVTYEKKP